MTADHAYAHSEELEGINGDMDVLVISDHWSKFLGVYPLKGKAAKYTHQALVHFAGNDKTQRVYSDNAREIRKPVMDIWNGTTVHDTSCPGVPQTNSIAEGKVKKMVNGTRVTLPTAGLPHCYWPLAAQCYAHHYNTKGKTGTSPWEKRHQGPFHGECFPFGCLVDFIPSPIYRGKTTTSTTADEAKESTGAQSSGDTPAATSVRKEQKKFDTNMTPGVFLGYKLHSGHVWHGEYYVAKLDEFATVNLHVSARSSEHSSIRIQTVREVRMTDTTITFPLRSEYERVNRTLEGIRSRLVPEADAYNCPSGDAQRVADESGQDLAAQMLGDNNADGDQKLQPHPHQADEEVPQTGGGSSSSTSPVSQAIQNAREDEWIETETAWMRKHHKPRHNLYVPQHDPNGISPPFNTLSSSRTSSKSTPSIIAKNV